MIKKIKITTDGETRANIQNKYELILVMCFF